MKLLLDEMLKRTTKWLRIFGVDTDFASGRDDNELLETAKKDGSVLVTRDEPLYAKCKKQGVRCVFVKSTKFEEQIAEVKSALSLEFTFPEKTRCPSCNTPLELVSGREVSGLVEENVLKRHDKFWICRKENKAYWEGSHWRNITRIYETSTRLAKEMEKKKGK